MQKIKTDFKKRLKKKCSFVASAYMMIKATTSQDDLKHYSSAGVLGADIANKVSIRTIRSFTLFRTWV